MSWKNIQLKWAALGLAALSSVGAVADEAKLRHEGVATCASSLCHGSSQPLKAYDNALQNEYTTWSQFDPHSNAYKVLLNKQSQEIANAVVPIIISYAKADRYNKISNFPRYTPKKAEGTWYPTPPGYFAAVEPYFSTIRPYTIIDSALASLEIQAPIAYSSAKNSSFTQAAREVYMAGKSKEEQKI